MRKNDLGGGYWKNAKVGSCCYGCEKRFLACHDVCETYLSAKSEWDEQKERLIEAKKKARVYEDYKCERIKNERKFKDSKGR